MSSECNTDNILELHNIHKSFGSVKVLHDVCLDIKRNSVHALLGENGAGKSTIVKIINGVQSFDSGKIIFEGKEVAFRNPAEAIDCGIGMVYQELSYAPNMSIAENLFLGKEPYKMKALKGIIDVKAMNEKARELFEEEGMAIDPKMLMRNLSVSDIQMVEIVKVVSMTNAKLVIMDEPTSSLSSRETVRLFEKIRSLKERGVSVIYISHKLDEVKQIADDVTILRNGYVIETNDIKKYEVGTIVDLIVGRKVKDAFPKNDAVPGETVLEVKNLTAPGTFYDINLAVKKGEIVGLAGLMGSGRTEVVRALVGLDPVTSGKMYLNGEQLKIKNVRDAIKSGVMMVSEDRQRQGMMQNLSIKDNATIVILNSLCIATFIQCKKEKKVAEEICKKLNVKLDTTNDSIKTLSGGNQQKIVLSKWLLAKPKVLILDEPTKGIDVGAKYEIYNLMIEMARQGIAIIMISSELHEVINMAHRIYLIKKGRIVGNLEKKKDFTEEKVLKVLAGGN